MQRRLRNVQRHVQSCCFVNANITFFLPFSLPSPSSLLKLAIVVILKFATMVTWRHTCPFHWRMVANVIGVLHDLTYTDRILRQRSHLVPVQGARVRYSLAERVGTNVNTDCFFQVPTLKFRPQKWTQAGCLCAYRGHSTALFLLLSWCFKMESGGAKRSSYNTHIHISGTQSLNTAQFCASNQALVPRHQVWRAAKDAFTFSARALVPGHSTKWCFVQTLGT